MNSLPESCKGCPLYDNHIGLGFMSPEGTGSSGVLVVAEALGDHEAQASLPLRPNAPAGSVFQGILRRMSGVDRNQFTITNSIWCRPGRYNFLDGAPYEFAAIEHCQQYNASLVRERRPRAIVTLGGIPTRTITGYSGEKQGITLIRGFALESSRPEYFVDGHPVPVIPTYHPSFLMRASKSRSKDKEVGGKVEKAVGGMGLTGVMMRDIKLAMDIAKFGMPEKVQFTAINGDQETMEWLISEAEAHPEWDLAWDIETPHSLAKAADESEIDSIKANILQIQFALNSGIGYVFPGFDVEWVKEGSRRLLAGRNRKLTWNGWKFDDKVVASYGLTIGGVNVDLMSAWAWLQPDLPKSLQYVTSFYAPTMRPWKHLNQVGDLTYGASDVIAPHLIAEGVFEALKAKGLWQSYERHVLFLRDEMVEAQRRGFPVDNVRHEAFEVKIDAEIGKITKQFPDLVPGSLLPLEPKADKKKKLVGVGYVGIPRQIKEFLNEAGDPIDGSDRVVIREEVPVLDEETGAEIGLETRHVLYTRRVVEVMDRESMETSSLLRWVRVLPFSANSGPQKIAYIQLKRDEEIQKRLEKGQSRAQAERLAKYAVPQVRDKKTKEMKDNTGSKELEKLFKSTGDILFKLLVEITKLNKLKGTYCGDDWKPKNDVVHTTFGLADTGTGQLSSKGPNIQNAPKHGALAKEFRFCVVAKPGKVLIEIDKKAFHAQTLALEARDKAYARLAALDVHSYMTAHRLKLPEAHQLLSWSDKDISAWFKTMKADEKTLYVSEAVPNFKDGMTFQQVRDYKSKKVILGIGFSQGAQSIFEQNPEGYSSKKEVQGFLDLFTSIFTGVRAFQQTITKRAHMDTQLISRWGYIRRFYDVFKWDPKKWNVASGTEGDWTHGDDFEAAVAFLPANDAFGMIKEEMLRLAGYRPRTGEDIQRFLAEKMIWRIQESENLLRKYGFVNQIHDSLIFHCDESLKDKCLEDVLAVMREPCLTLADPIMCPEGFFVDSEAMVGPDWAHMDSVKG